jgi:hypothetical protein
MHGDAIQWRWMRPQRNFTCGLHVMVLISSYSYWSAGALQYLLRLSEGGAEEREGPHYESVFVDHRTVYC